MEKDIKSQKKPLFWLKLIIFVGLSLWGVIHWGMFYLCIIFPFLWGAFWGLD